MRSVLLALGTNAPGHRVESPAPCGTTEAINGIVSLQVLYVLSSFYTSHMYVTISYTSIIGNTLQKIIRVLYMTLMSVFAVFVSIDGIKS